MVLSAPLATQGGGRQGAADEPRRGRRLELSKRLGAPAIGRLTVSASAAASSRWKAGRARASRRRRAGSPRGSQRSGSRSSPTREPGGTPHAEGCARLILSGALRELGPAAEAIAFAAARIDHVDALIRPALERGAWVVCDRFADSTRAYQGAAGKPRRRLRRAAGARRRRRRRAPTSRSSSTLPAEQGLARAARRGGRRRGRPLRARGPGVPRARCAGPSSTSPRPSPSAAPSSTPAADEETVARRRSGPRSSRRARRLSARTCDMRRPTPEDGAPRERRLSRRAARRASRPRSSAMRRRKRRCWRPIAAAGSPTPG